VQTVPISMDGYSVYSSGTTVQTVPMSADISMITLTTNRVAEADDDDVRHRGLRLAEEVAQEKRDKNERTRARRARKKKEQARQAKPSSSGLSANQERRARRAKMQARYDWLSTKREGDVMPEELRVLPCTPGSRKGKGTDKGTGQKKADK